MKHVKLLARLLMALLLFVAVSTAFSHNVKSGIEMNPNYAECMDLVNRLLQLPTTYDANEVNKIKAAMANVDRSYLHGMVNVDSKVRLINGKITDQPEFAIVKGKMVPGTRIYYDDVPGACNGLLACVRLGLPDSDSTALHEVGHVVNNYVMKNAAWHSQFVPLWNMEAALFTTNTHFINYPDEYYAQTFADYFRNTTTRSQLLTKAPLTYNYFNLYSIPKLYKNDYIYNTYKYIRNTTLSGTGADSSYKFLLAKNNDLYMIKKANTASHMTEVHVLSDASQYKTFIFQKATPLGETGDNWDFILADNNDLVCILKSGGASGKTEVHILTAASNYQTYSVHAVTGLGQTDGNYAFMMNGNRDLYVVKKRNSSTTGNTEVYILSSASNYASFTFNAITPITWADQDCDFQIDYHNDIYCIKKKNTVSGKVEVSKLNSLTGYQTLMLQSQAGVYTRFDNDYPDDYMIAANKDLVVVQKEKYGYSVVNRFVAAKYLGPEFY